MLHQAYPSLLSPHKRPSPQPLPAILLPQPAPVRYLMDPLAFFAALIGAPLLVAVLGFWVLLIPVFAVVMGGLPYLIIGTPLLLYYIPRHGAVPHDIALLAIKVTATGAFITGSLAYAMDPTLPIQGTLFLATMAIIFAGIWANVFGWLYGKFQRDFYKYARP